MTTHLLAYVQSRILGRWKRLCLKHARRRQPIFAYGSDDDRQFKEHARDGAVLWLLASHRGYPPTLAARLTAVQRVDERRNMGVSRAFLRDLKHPEREKPYDYRVKGGRGSCFFGHNDAANVLKKLGLLGLHGELVKKPGETWKPSAHGTMLLRAHRIDDASPLAEFAAELQRQTVFISWKHSDTKGLRHANVSRRKKVRQFVRSLNGHGFAVWLDELALPNYRPRSEDDALLELLLRQGLAQSCAVVAVATDHYGTKSACSPENWTKKEWQSKTKRNRAVLLLNPARHVRSVRTDDRRGVDLESAGLLRLTGTPSQAALKLIRATSSPGNVGAITQSR